MTDKLMQNGPRLRRLATLACAGLIATIGCSVRDRGLDEAGRVALKSSASERSLRRAYDGAPPVIPHDELGAECSSCHGERGVGIEGLGYSPPHPHGETPGMSAPRCRQCHVPRTTDDLFVASTFVGLGTGVGPGLLPAPRQHPDAPPIIPHRVFMRESCLACHGGGAAREEIRTSHPDRARCRQCHVPSTTTVGSVFPASSGAES